MNEMIIQYNVSDAAIEELREQYGNVETVEGDAGLALLKEDIAVVRTLRTSVEAKRKELKKDALEYGRKVDSEAKRITAKLLEIEEPMKAEKERFEAIAENERLEAARIDAERLATIQARIDGQAALPMALIGKPVEEIAVAIATLESPDDFDYQELAGKHALALVETLPTLRRMHELEVKRVADAEAAAERDRLAEIERKELEAEREKFAAEQRVKDEEAARERAAAEAERKRLADIEEEQLARERERLAEERRRMDDEKREAEEARKAEKAKRKMITCPHCGKEFEVSR